MFFSWVHTLNYVRNICAHHARLWNREIKIVPSLLRFSKEKVWIANPEEVKRSKVYYTLCMINYLLQSVNPNSSFSLRLKQLIAEYSPKLTSMGFTDSWEYYEFYEYYEHYEYWEFALNSLKSLNSLFAPTP